jgi:hypothetical protein
MNLIKNVQLLPLARSRWVIHLEKAIKKTQAISGILYIISLLWARYYHSFYAVEMFYWVFTPLLIIAIRHRVHYGRWESPKDFIADDLTLILSLVSLVVGAYTLFRIATLN